MSTNRIPYFDFYPVDFMRGVRGLTAAEVGIYTMLLCRIYEENGPVEYQPIRLSAYCGVRESTLTKAVDRLIAIGRIAVKDGVICDDRAMKEIGIRETKLKNSSRAGKASAEKRQQKQQTEATLVQQPFNHTDRDIDKKKEEPNGSSKKRSKLPDEWRLPKEWGEWAIGKGMDELSVRREAEQFANHHQSRGTLMADWRKAWQTWVGNNLKWKAERRPSERQSFPKIGDVREYPNGVVKQYSGVGVGWIPIHA